MIITCKCLNLTVTCGQIDNTATVAAATTDKNDGLVPTKAILDDSNLLSELQKFKKNTKFYNECMDFFRQAIGPIAEATYTPNQIDLVYTVPINNWIINFCINCNKITHAKNIPDAIYLINPNLLTNNEEIAQRKTDKAFSTIFGILMYDHLRMSPTTEPGFLNFAAHKKSTTDDSRLKNLHKVLQQRLQKEITDTDDRIRRYTEQQFALLKSFRDKSEQEYQILVSLVNQVPDNLKQIDAIDNSSAFADNATSTSLNGSAIPANTPNQLQATSSLFSLLSKQVTSFDTPPATPDSTPMSVGNSPTFRQVFGRLGNGFGLTSAMSSKASNDNNEECLFELEGFDSYPVSTYSGGFDMSDVEETEDGEDALGDLNDGIPMSRRNATNGNEKSKIDYSIAKSLPIAIAKSFENKRANFVDSEDELPEDNVDIAASIKALAKSVHGDKVFGDLPRPRFSTQI